MNENDKNQGFWKSVKQSFAYGLGGSLGWQAGNLIGGAIGWLFRRAWLLLFVPVPYYMLAINETAKAERQQAKPAIVKKVDAPARQGGKQQSAEQKSEDKPSNAPILFGRPLY